MSHQCNHVVSQVTVSYSPLHAVLNIFTSTFRQLLAHLLMKLVFGISLISLRIISVLYVDFPLLLMPCSLAFAKLLLLHLWVR